MFRKRLENDTKDLKILRDKKLNGGGLKKKQTLRNLTKLENFLDTNRGIASCFNRPAVSLYIDTHGRSSQSC